MGSSRNAVANVPSPRIGGVVVLDVFFRGGGDCLRIRGGMAGVVSSHLWRHAPIHRTTGPTFSQRMWVYSDAVVTRSFVWSPLPQSHTVLSSSCAFTPTVHVLCVHKWSFQRRNTIVGFFRTPPRNTVEPSLLKHWQNALVVRHCAWGQQFLP